MNGVEQARWRLVMERVSGRGPRVEAYLVVPGLEPSRRGDEDEDEHQPWLSNHRGDSDMTKTELERAVAARSPRSSA
jgi:hypothetical protein